MYNKSSKILLKHIQEVLHKWKWIPSSWTRRLHIVERSVRPKAGYRLSVILNAISSKIKEKMSIFYKNRKTRPKIHMESQGTLTSLNSLVKEEQSQSTQHYSFSKRSTKPQWAREFANVLLACRQIYPWTKENRRNPWIHCQMIFDKGAWTIQSGKE